MANTWFISDTHFRHRRAVADRLSIPIDEVTDADVSAHDEGIIRVCNRMIQPGDRVWHLGDVAIIPPRRFADLTRRLVGHWNLVPGNHDKAHPAFGESSVHHFSDTLDAGFQWISPFASVKIDLGSGRHTDVALSHFPYEDDHTDRARWSQWRLRDEGGLLIHGHLHSESAMTSPREVHVGWDTWHRPVSIHEVAELFSLAS